MLNIGDPVFENRDALDDVGRLLHRLILTSGSPLGRLGLLPTWVDTSSFWNTEPHATAQGIWWSGPEHCEAQAFEPLHLEVTYVEQALCPLADRVLCKVVRWLRMGRAVASRRNYPRHGHPAETNLLSARKVQWSGIEPQPMIEVRLRRLEIPHVGVFNVPTNVSRVDHRLTHGWNVRFLSRRQRTSKFFSDNVLGGPRDSFKAACTYANQHRPMPKTQAVEGEGGGMRFVEALSHGRKTRLVYLELSGIRAAAAPIRLYVGTRNTACPERREAVWRKGLRVRETMLKRYKAEIRKRALRSRSRLAVS